MRKLLLLILAGMALPAFAARRVTVEQLQQVLASASVKPDEETARQLADLQLTERASSARLSLWKAELPGPKARQALVALVDLSAFLRPPAAEMPTLPAPDFATQRQIMFSAANYVSRIIPKLPNFFARRDTSSYEDTPTEHGIGHMDFAGYQPIHPVGTSSVTVLYRDGKEIVDTGAARGKKPQSQAEGLSTWGVFGPILGTVLVDAAKSTLAWSHWEQAAGGTLAVFRYAVPREKSNYEVKFVVGQYVFKELVGYHGEMAIDPASGAILRLALEADMKPDELIGRADILVEYGPVEIGGKTYICPLKSVSISLAQVVRKAAGFYYSGTFPGAKQTLLNDVAFGQYHLFRAEARILTGDRAEAENAPPAADGKDSSLAAAPGEPQGTEVPAVEKAAQAIPAPAPAAILSEISVAEATGLPEAAAPGTELPSTELLETGFVLHTTARLVDVVVVAQDKKGHPVTDLKREDFEIYDDGDRQRIQFFTPAGSGPALEPATTPSRQSDPTAQTANEQARPTYSNRRGTEAGVKPETQGNLTILLIDGSNLAFPDLTRVRAEMLRFLGSLQAGERVGLYAMKTLGFEVLLEPTANRALLADKLRQWMPSAQDMARAQGEETRNRQQFETVRSLQDLANVNGNDSDEPDSAATVDPQLRDFGANPGKQALSILVGVARHLAAIPGHKNLVWVTSDNVLADWNDRAVSVDKGIKHIEESALLAQEAMNNAHASVYPLDASALEGGAIGASIKNRNVELSPAAGTTPRNMQPGRITAAMQQDMHPIQGPMREVAEATGGRALRRAGDLAAELNGVVEDGRAAYQLSFTPDVPADNHYHRLTVKLTARRDVTLRYRTGYLYDRAADTLKERFREAVWQPADASEIALSANLAAAEKGSALKLNIAVPDLDLAQQGELWTDKLDIFLVERNDARMQAKVTGKTLGLRLKPATYQKLLREGIAFEQTVQTAPDAGSVRIVVVDENSGRMGSVTVPATALKSKQ
ncbi:MAG: VWA domain-containing protein [Terracidiphilus sp.]|nr:VWA domain-containing protein [Terracidiphilus sp.]MDR3775703.1 VWA domain-containing protein [Terracidiphilus sp.]